MKSTSVTRPVRKAVIPAAGFGTRFLPVAKAVPKEMLPIVDRPVIELVVEEAVAAGITDILMVIGRGKRAIEEYFGPHPELEQQLEKAGKREAMDRVRRVSGLARVHYVWQGSMRGLGDAVLHGRTFCGDEPFALMLGDTILEPAAGAAPVIGQLIEARARHGGGSVVAVEQVAADKVSRYGIVGGDEIEPGVMRATTLVEKPSVDRAPSRLAIASRYLFEPEIFDQLAATPAGKNGEIQLTDAMAALVAAGGLMHAVTVAGHRHDIGNPLDFVKANVHYALRHGDPAQAADLRRWLRRELELAAAPGTSEE